MCGINGIISKDRLNIETIQLMNKQIYHRGPDEEGIYQSDKVMLGIRRLSIIDLEEGSQPIYNENNSMVIVFNGEIYNYQHLKNQLIERGHKFRTDSDTEVILHLYEEKGENCLQDLNGMFVFAIYDMVKQEIFIARDRLGKKPLYYCFIDNHFIFSSELKSILKVFPERRSLSPQAIELYFSLTFIPAPYTIFQDIYKLEPAYFMKVDLNLKYKISSYWSLQSVIERENEIDDYDNYKKTIKDILYNSVELRMIADVPLGAFLSGGIDSSIVVGLMSEISSKKIRTFTIGHKFKAYDESKNAEQTAKHFATDHHVFFIDDDRYLEILDKVINNFDEPFADSSALPTYLVSEFARREVKVVLTGDGGDEIFGGYNRYLIFYYLKKYLIIPSILRKLLIRPLTNFLPTTTGMSRTFSKVKKVVNNEGVSAFDQYYYLQRMGYSEEELIRIFKRRESLGFARSLSLAKFEEVNTRSIYDKIFYTDIVIGLEGDMLVKVDRTTMLNSLEARCPFLDYRLIEYAFTIPDQYKINRGRLKYILKDTFKYLLPQEIYHQPKRGFELPIGYFLKNPLREKFQQYLNLEILKALGLINLELISDLYDTHSAGIDKSYQLWTFFVFANWIAKFQNYIKSSE